jgi:hypothetical protein
MTMLRDHCTAEAFLAQAMEEVPGFQPELSPALECYQEMARLRNEMDDLIGDNFTEKAMRAIGDPAIRRAYADKILDIVAGEQQAISHIQHLIERAS